MERKSTGVVCRIWKELKMEDKELFKQFGDPCPGGTIMFVTQKEAANLYNIVMVAFNEAKEESWIP